MTRHGFDADSIDAMKDAFKRLFRGNGSTSDQLDMLRAEYCWRRAEVCWRWVEEAPLPPPSLVPPSPKTTGLPAINKKNWVIG